jgi:hypothetical protein
LSKRPPVARVKEIVAEEARKLRATANNEEIQERDRKIYMQAQKIFELERLVEVNNQEIQERDRKIDMQAQKKFELERLVEAKNIKLGAAVSRENYNNVRTR